MKKAIKFIALALALVSVFAFAGCGKKSTKKVKVINIELTEESYAFVLKKGNTDLQATANELLSDLKESGDLNVIINSFFNGEATFTYTNPASPDGCFIVATNAYFPPFEYYEGNKLTGVDIYLASLLAQKVGKTLYVLDEEFSSIFNSLDNEEADIGMAGITVNETRLLSYDFTDEYYTSAQVITVKANNKMFDKCKTAADIEEILKSQDSTFIVVTQTGTTGYMYSFGNEDFEYEGFSNLTTQAYTNGALAMQDLDNGVINAVILDKQPSIMIAKAINK